MRTVSIAVILAAGKPMRLAALEGALPQCGERSVDVDPEFRVWISPLQAAGT